MAESPFNRPKACNLIGDVIAEIYAMRIKEPTMCGFTMEMSIYTMLKDAGYLTEEAMVPDEH